MSLKNILLLSGSAGFLIIGIHQTMLYGMMASYWIFMLSVGLLLLYKYNKDQQT